MMDYNNHEAGYYTHIVQKNILFSIDLDME